ncbi:unnamed protein product [Caenorhabditis brenneri]
MLDVLRFDRESAVNNGSFEIYSLVFKLEITVNFIGILYYIMNVSIDYRTRNSMNNMRRIHQFVYFTCPFNHLAFIVEKIMIIWDFEGGYVATTTTFQTIQFIRLVTTFAGFLCLPAYAIERSFATYFHHDYEKENRSYIGYTMSFLIYLISIISVLVCIQYVNDENEWVYENRRTSSERAETRSLFQFFHLFALTVALFATFCSFLLLLASLPFTNTQKNICIVLFDTLYTIFILYCPYIHYKYNSTWQHEFKKCMKMSTSEVKCSSVSVGKPSLQLKTTFGERMNVGKNVQMDIYFSQLTTSWNTTKPNEA